MTGKQLEKLEQARDLIFEVEQEWRTEAGIITADNTSVSPKAYAADTLYKTRIELNNAMSRG